MLGMLEKQGQCGVRDRRRIELNKPYEVRVWALRFGVSKEELKLAVSVVGSRAGEVEQYLQRGGS